MTTKKKRGPGRPRREKKVSEARLVARCSDVELAAATRAAEILEMKLSDFIREAVNEHIANTHLEHEPIDTGAIMAAARRMRR